MANRIKGITVELGGNTTASKHDSVSVAKLTQLFEITIAFLFYYTFYHSSALNRHHTDCDSRACAKILPRYMDSSVNVNSFGKNYYFYMLQSS